MLTPGSAYHGLTLSHGLAPMDFLPRAPFLTKPLRRQEDWVERFRKHEFPVLASSAEALERLRADEDSVDAHLIGQTFENDPLLTLKVLIHASNLNRMRRTNDAETLTSAVVLMGITPFFNLLGPQPTLEEWLAGDAEALEGVDAVLGRCERASRFALGFAAHRMDPDANILHQAALLHDFAELLLWCHAPDLAKSIRNLAQQGGSTAGLGRRLDDGPEGIDSRLAFARGVCPPVGRTRSARSSRPMRLLGHPRRPAQHVGLGQRRAAR